MRIKRSTAYRTGKVASPYTPDRETQYATQVMIRGCRRFMPVLMWPVIARSSSTCLRRGRGPLRYASLPWSPDRLSSLSISRITLYSRLSSGPQA